MNAGYLLGSLFIAVIVVVAAAVLAVGIFGETILASGVGIAGIAVLALAGIIAVFGGNL